MAKHIKVLGKGDPSKLSDELYIQNVIEECIRRAGMRPLGEPLTVNVPLEIQKLNQEPFEDEGGISVLRLLSTSHISIHTWPLRSEFHFDLYSCRDFLLNDIMSLLKDAFQIEKYKVSDISDTCEW